MCPYSLETPEDPSQDTPSRSFPWTSPDHSWGCIFSREHQHAEDISLHPEQVQIVTIAIYGITGLHLARRIQPIHQASWLATANGYIRAINADLRFSFTRQHAPEYYVSRVTNYSCGISFNYDDGQILRLKSQRLWLGLRPPTIKADLLLLSRGTDPGDLNPERVLKTLCNLFDLVKSFSLCIMVFPLCGFST